MILILIILKGSGRRDNETTMPGKNSYKKRKYTKKMASIPRNPSRLKYPGVCPDVMQVQLKYSTNSLYNAASPNVKVYRGNGAFDPEFAVGGGQPMGFDQWSAFYRRYRVIACKVTARATNGISTNSSGVFVVPLNTSAITTSPSEYLEHHKCKQTDTTMLSSGSSSCSVVNYTSTASQRGLPYDGVQYERDLSASTGANPTQEWFWHVGVYDPSGSVSTVDSTVALEIVYYIEFFDRQTLSRS